MAVGRAVTTEHLNHCVCEMLPCLGRFGKKAQDLVIGHWKTAMRALYVLEQ